MKNKPYRYYLYLLLRLGIAFVRLLPRSAALMLAKGLGWLAYYLVPRQRNKALENLRRAYRGEKGDAELRALARRVFENLAMTLADLAFIRRMRRENLREFMDLNGLFERCRELLREGRGLIVISGHLGNWELMGSIFGIEGFRGGVIGRRIYYDKYNDLIVRSRLEKGVPTFYQDESPREILRQLKAGGVIGVVADQDVERLEGAFVEYFSLPSYTPVAPVRLAQVSGAPILVGALIRRGTRYEVVFDPEPIRVPRGADEKTVAALTEQWSRRLERIIRQYPEQWVWNHDRWKTKREQRPEVALTPAAEACFRRTDFSRNASPLPREGGVKLEVLKAC